MDGSQALMFIYLWWTAAKLWCLSIYDGRQPSSDVYLSMYTSKYGTRSKYSVKVLVKVRGQSTLKGSARCFLDGIWPLKKFKGSNKVGVNDAESHTPERNCTHPSVTVSVTVLDDLLNTKVLSRPVSTETVESSQHCIHPSHRRNGNATPRLGLRAGPPYVLGHLHKLRSRSTLTLTLTLWCGSLSHARAIRQALFNHYIHQFGM
jgi:hypothetical protein